MDHVVITGATCAVGVALTEICLEKGCLVTALVREDSPHRDRLPRSDRLRLASRGLSDLSDLEANELGNCDVFYHLAWTDTDRDGRYDVGCSIRISSTRWMPWLWPGVWAAGSLWERAPRRSMECERE